MAASCNIIERATQQLHTVEEMQQLHGIKETQLQPSFGLWLRAVARAAVKHVQNLARDHPQ